MYSLVYVHSFSVLILSHVHALFGAASISLHQCPLTIQEEAPPPQWLTPISCIWLGHWCRTKLWHCTSQSKLCSLSLLSPGTIHSLMFLLNLFDDYSKKKTLSVSTENKCEWLYVLCCCDLRYEIWWNFLGIVLNAVTREHRDKQRERQVGLWPWELWVREDGAQQERSILI